MSPLSKQFTDFLQPELAEELNSESPWLGGTISSTSHEDSFRSLEGAATPLEGSPIPPSVHLLPWFDDDYLGPPSGDAERVNFADFTLDAWVMPFGTQSDNPFDHSYQATHIDLFQNEPGTCDPVQTMTIYEVSLPASTPSDSSVASITQTLSATHLPSTPVDPSAMATYAPYFDQGCDSRVPSTSVNESTASPPPTSSPPSSPRSGGSESDGEGDTDYVPPSDDDDEYRPTPVTSFRKQKMRKAASKYKSPRRAAYSPACSTSSESEKSATSSRARSRSHPYKPRVSSRNFQREDGARLIDKKSDFQCPVVGCDYVQKNQRIPDLRRHVVTHDRWMEPEKWTCCGVGMERAYLYGRGIEEGMTKEEQINAGAYLFKNQLMIGGCMKAFSRRDALKRHVDNPNVRCVGHMDSYNY